MNPQARKANVLEETIGEEVVVYDTLSHEAYHLNAGAAVVWHHCNGVSDVAQIIKSIEILVGQGDQEKFVLSALYELMKNGLVKGRLPRSANWSIGEEATGATGPKPLPAAEVTRLAVPSPAAAASAAKAVLIADQ